jgi:hypothetical protein
MEIDRSDLIASLGGDAAVKQMDHESRADALEDYLSARLESVVAARKGITKYPTVAELESQVDQRGYRRGVGRLMIHAHSNKAPNADERSLNVSRLAPLPEKPTLVDFFNGRFATTMHLLQSARLAQKRGVSEEIVLACLLHDAAQALIKTDHGWWGAQLFEPYV